MGRWSMKRSLLIFAALLLIGTSPPVSEGAAVPRQDAEKAAHLLAELLDSGRIVVERNQTLIDDPHKGFKGFTPETFERELNDEFRSRTGLDLAHLSRSSTAVPPLARELLPALVEASKEVVADAQVVINQRGIGYKNFIPATFGSQASARFSAKSHVRLKQTTLTPRNPKNTPDSYEAAVLRRLAAGPTKAGPLSEVTTNGSLLRVLTPVYYARGCLKCHGAEAGELDISGYPKEGAREGELAGAISVSIPLEDR
jgi:hypothetical protein